LTCDDAVLPRCIANDPLLACVRHSLLADHPATCDGFALMEFNRGVGWALRFVCGLAPVYEQVEQLTALAPVHQHAAVMSV
jgi:hypothetical protein